MEELDEEKIIKLAEEYAESRAQFFRPWIDSYKLACKNAFVNAYVLGYFARCKEVDPGFVEPNFYDEVKTDKN